MTRLESITHQIEEYSADSHIDGYHQGYDEAWDEARDKGFDEGYEAAIDRILDDWIEVTNWVVTPETTEELHKLLQTHKDNGPMCVMMTMNYLRVMIESMK